MNIIAPVRNWIRVALLAVIVYRRHRRQINDHGADEYVRVTKELAEE